jgi:hypothetical protein
VISDVQISQTERDIHAAKVGAGKKGGRGGGQFSCVKRKKILHISYVNNTVIYGSQEKHRVNVKANIYQNRAERAMQRGEYLAAIDECQMGKARILKRNKKSPLHSALL